MNTLVSILIPVIRDRWLKEAIESALNQTYKNIEVIVCGTPDFYKICKNYPVRFIDNDEPRDNAIKAFQYARGKYIKYLCDDDILKPTCVKDLKRGLDKEGVTLATSFRELINAEGERLPDGFNSKLGYVEKIIKGRDMLYLTMMTKFNVIGEPSTVMFRKQDVESPLSFNNIRSDIAGWVQLLTKGDLYYTPKPLSQFRQHPGQHQWQEDYRSIAYQMWDNLAQEIYNFRLGA